MFGSKVGNLSLTDLRKAKRSLLTDDVVTRIDKLENEVQQLKMSCPLQRGKKALANASVGTDDPKATKFVTYNLADTDRSPSPTKYFNGP